jgi:hypothetical protein
MSRVTVLLRWKETGTPGVWAGYCGWCDKLLAVSKPLHGRYGLQVEPGYKIGADEVYRYTGSARDRFVDRGRDRKKLGRGHVTFYGVPGARQKYLRKPGAFAQHIECRCGVQNNVVPLPEAPPKQGRRPPRIVMVMGDEPVTEGPGVPRKRLIIRWKRPPRDKGFAQGTPDVL